jgi:hypothetical protein
MRGPKRERHNRQSQVLLASHPECEACSALREILQKQIVANGRLRLEVYDLRRELNVLVHGRDYGLPDLDDRRHVLAGDADTYRTEPGAVHGPGALED